LRRATTYAINQRFFFRRCFEDGRFEIDKDACSYCTSYAKTACARWNRPDAVFA
jgi:hypothetical protein